MGVYTCIARNGIPPAKSKAVEVLVNCKILFLKSIIKKLCLFVAVVAVKPQIFMAKEVIGAPLGVRISLHCVVEAFPKAIAYWTDKNGTAK